MTDAKIGKILRDDAGKDDIEIAANTLFPADPPGPTEKVVDRVSVAAVRVGDGPRFAAENSEHIRLIAESEAALPPIVVHRASMRLIDGRHRLRAAELRGDTHIDAVFFEGPEADAFALAVRANVTHGLPLSLAERTAAAERILRTHPHWSDNAIASCAGLATKTVAGIRCSTEDIPRLNSRLGRDGRVRPIDASAGRERAARLIVEHPEASLREVARQAGVSPATVQDVRDRVQRGESAVPSGKRARRRAPRPADKQPEALSELIHSLQKDPSVRFSESGRKLVRLLCSQPLEPELWEILTANIPTHWNDAVARIAMQHAANWERFANRLVDHRKSAS